MNERRRILFVCVGNTCRSQMAEGFASAIGADRVEAKSAGTNAMGIVNRSTVDAMADVGIDISAHVSEQLTDGLFEWADVVVSMGGAPSETLCPESFKGEKHDWPIDDPIGRPAEVMQRVRDDIERRVRELIGE